MYCSWGLPGHPFLWKYYPDLFVALSISKCCIKFVLQQVVPRNLNRYCCNSKRYSGIFWLITGKESPKLPLYLTVRPCSLYRLTKFKDCRTQSCPSSESLSASPSLYSQFHGKSLFAEVTQFFFCQLSTSWEIPKQTLSDLCQSTAGLNILTVPQPFAGLCE